MTDLLTPYRYRGNVLKYSSIRYGAYYPYYPFSSHADNSYSDIDKKLGCYFFRTSIITSIEVKIAVRLSSRSMIAINKKIQKVRGRETKDIEGEERAS